MSIVSRSVLVVAIALPGFAAAQATPQGAADLTAVFQTYLGKTPGVVSVVADGDAYAVTLDAGPFVAMIPAEAGVTVSVSPFAMRLTDNGDGTWGVAQDQQLRISASVPGQMEFTVAMERAICTGVFDAALQDFSKNDCDITGLSVDQVIDDPMMGRQVTSQVSERLVTGFTGAAGAAGGIDGVYTYAETNVRAVLEGPLAPGMPPVTLVLSYPETRLDGTITGWRTADLLKALAWVVANPNEEAMTANRAEIRDIMTAGLPLFEEIDIGGAVTDLSVESPVGVFAAGEVSVGATIRGAVEDGLYRIALGFDGLTVPTGVVPAFAEALMPETLSVDFALGGYDAAGAAEVLLGLFDLEPGTEPGPEFNGALMSALMPDGTVDITLAPGDISNAMYSLSYEGTMTAGPMAPPTGSGTVTATGIDKVMEVLDGAPDEIKQQVLPVLGMATGLAQAGPDGQMVWEIDATTPGSLLVNGMDLMGMQ